MKPTDRLARLHARLMSRHSGTDPEGGYVLVMMALMFVLLMMFAGYSVDASNWNVERNKTQTAAEAAALAGVAFLPDDFSAAKLTAEQIALLHGFPASQVSVAFGSGSNQLAVTIDNTVGNYFLRVVGNDTTTISSVATAEFEQPVEMGSPDFILGNDPVAGTSPDYWLSIASAHVDKALGDRFATEDCTVGTANCSGPNNLEYDVSGYKYAVRVTDLTQPLRIQIFDPAWTWTGSDCNIPNWPTASEIATIGALGGTNGIPPGYYSNAAARYAGGNTPYCTGDDRPGNNGPATRFTVRLPDDSPWNDNDNLTVTGVSTCSVETFPAYEPTSAYALPTQSIYELLDPTVGTDNEWEVDSSDGVLTFAEVFRRWVTICEIPANQLVLGDYIIQVQTTDSTAGQNRFSLRAGPPDNVTGGVLDVGQSTFSRGRLPIYANSPSANIDFFLARVPPSTGERFLRVTFFDVGDAAAPGTLSVLPAVGAIPGNVFSTCEFTLSGAPIGSSNCSISNVQAATYGGKIVEVLVTVPSQLDATPYWCDVTDPSACWVKVNASFPGGITDSTTWTAELIGDAVRLVPN